uniref:Inactive dipeptidyl peptidase 10-like n=1 Tax=Hucho hucho TaxID=62062 RepID=A0A4W5N9X1_9TELE
MCVCFSWQDMHGSTGPPRNWKGIAIAMVVIVGVLSLVILSVIMLTPDESHLLLQSRFTMEDLANEKYSVHDPSLYLPCSDNGLVLSLCCCQAYVFEGDIYYQPAMTSKPLRLTSTGREGLVVNGLSDWMYEEEVLLTYSAHWWSKDGARLAYFTINNSATPLMEIPYFLGGVYPSNVFFPYPKAGSAIPTVSLFVVNLYGPAHTLEMIPPDSLRARDSYISMVKWISSTRLVVRWLNRAQNQSELCVCEATTGACSEDVPLFSSDGSWFYLTLPAKQGARGEFRHIASLPAQVSVRAIKFYTPVSSSNGLKSDCLLSLQQGDIQQYFLKVFGHSVVFLSLSVDLEGIFQRQCLTCYLLDGCSFFKAEFSPNQTYFTLYCLGPGVPKVTVHTTKDPSSELQSGSSDNQLTLFLLLSHRDGVPGSQSVTEEFAMGWPEVLASTHDVALAWVDGRSGVGWGQKISSVDPRKLSSLRVKDQLGVVEWLMQLPYIDDRRIALYGKAFGGYLSLKMLAATDQLFKCAVAVAPITDFKLYSAAFSERYLGPPAKEEHTYLVRIIFNHKHQYHSAELLSRLVKVEANYSLQLYPDEGHTLREQRSIQHFQQTLVHYLQTCLRHNPLLASIEEPDEDEEDD